MKREYESLIEAARDLAARALELSSVDGNMTSPAWRMVWHAQEHVLKLADQLLRGEK